MKSTYDRDPSGNNNKQCGDIALFGLKRHDILLLWEKCIAQYTFKEYIENINLSMR